MGVPSLVAFKVTFTGGVGCGCQGVALFFGAVVVFPKSAPVMVAGVKEIMAGGGGGVVLKGSGVGSLEINALLDNALLVGHGEAVPLCRGVVPIGEFSALLAFLRFLGEEKRDDISTGEGVELGKRGFAFHGVKIPVG